MNDGGTKMKGKHVVSVLAAILIATTVLPLLETRPAAQTPPVIIFPTSINQPTETHTGRRLVRTSDGNLHLVFADTTGAGIREIRYADLVGIPGKDEADGGPPLAARYITRGTHAYRLPSMEIQRPLIYSPAAFRSLFVMSVFSQVNSASSRPKWP